MALAELVSWHFDKQGFRVSQTADGEEAMLIAREERPDIVLLDWMIENLSGIEVCRRLRRDNDTSNIPIIMMSARGEEEDRVRGLDIGADDYVTKPFSPREIVARVKAILRRGQPDTRDAHDVVHVGDDYQIDITRREARCKGEAVALATREFDLLAHLARNQGIALTRQQLLDSVWGADWYGDDRTVDVHVRQLRKKLGDDLPLATVWGIGYRLG